MNNGKKLGLLREYILSLQQEVFIKNKLDSEFAEYCPEYEILLNVLHKMNELEGILK